MSSIITKKTCPAGRCCAAWARRSRCRCSTAWSRPSRRRRPYRGAPLGRDLRAERMNIWQWTPTTEGAAFELTPILQPLAPFRDHMVVAERPGQQRRRSAARRRHRRPCPARKPAFLTGAHAKKTEGADLDAGISMDQIVAKEFGKQTQLASLELALENNETGGGLRKRLQLRLHRHDRLAQPNDAVADGDEPARGVRAHVRRRGQDRSAGRAWRASRGAQHPRLRDRASWRTSSERSGVTDHRKLTEYLDAVRDIERRIQKAEEQSDRELPTVEQPQGYPGRVRGVRQASCST